MMTCQSCREQLLEYVYGLLDTSDPAEAGTLVELRSHLETCATCQAAFAQAKKQQTLLGEASRAKSELIFSIPKVETSHSRFVHQRSTYVAWYVTAASLVFALILGTGSAYWWGKETKWKAVETSRLELSRLSSVTDENKPLAEELGLQIATQASTVQQLARSVKEVEKATQQQLAASTSYQQVLAPGRVTANNDAPIVIWNSTLSGTPSPLPEVNSRLVEDFSKNTISEQNRRNDTASNKVNLDLKSVAFAGYANRSLNNEVAQDLSTKAALGKVIHPIQVFPTRYSAHLCTDKPIYQPGEDVYFRGLALDRTFFTAPREDLHFTFNLTLPDGVSAKQWSKTAQLLDPQTQQPLRDVRGQVIQAIGGDTFTLPKNMPLGECQLTLTEKNDRFDMQTIKFIVNNLAAPRFEKQLQFNRASYAPGNEVIVTGKVKLPSQQPWTNGNILGQILIDGQQYDAQGSITRENIKSSTDASGNVKLSFMLPPTIKAGQGILALQFVSHEGNEHWSHPLRIETGELQVDCYPEGGDLIAGVPNTVYFQMRNKHGEAMEGAAELVDSRQQHVKTLATFHDDTEARASRGMGMFSFTPRANETYQIRMKKPSAAPVTLRLPMAKPSGVGLHIDQTVLAAVAPIQLTLSNVGQARDLAICVYCRGELIALDQYTMAAGMTQTILVQTNKPLGGVYRVTIAEIVTQNGSRQLQPLAERLLYRHPSKVLHLGLQSEPAAGRKATLKIDARTETRQPSPAYLTIVGVNKSLLQMAEATTTRRLPAHFLIAQEVRQPEELEFADFFLSQHPSAERALDLLLGVQGWRRFKETDDTAALDQLSRKDKLPIHYYDNRQEMNNLVQQQVSDKIAGSSEGKQLAQAEKKLLELRSQMLLQNSKQAETAKDRQMEVAGAETLYKKTEEQWNLFSIWFHLISAGVLGIMSLAGLVALFLRRAILPTHLVCTIGFLSVMGIVGTVLLWYWHESGQISSPLEPAKAVAEESKSQPQARKEIQHGISSDKPNLEASSALASQQTDKRDRSHELAAPAKMVPPSALDEKKLADDKPGNTSLEYRKAEEAGRKQGAGGATVPSTTPAPSDKVGVRVFGQEPYSKEQLHRKADAKVQQEGQINNNRTRLTDNRAGNLPTIPSQQQPDASKLKENVAVSKDMAKAGDKNVPPAPLSAGAAPGGFGGGAGDVRLGNAGRGGLDSAAVPTSPAKNMNALKGRGKGEEGAEAIRDLLNNTTAFFVREYAWKPETRPASMMSPGSWSKTIYWHPMQVVPATGLLEIPIDVPVSDGVYHFEVFGHDGEGRLGAASIDVKSTGTPVSLQTRLSTADARVGDTVQLECQVQNLTSRRQPQVIARIGLPEGITLSPNLKQLSNAVKKANSEEDLEPTKWYVQGRELTLICPELATGQRVKLSIALTCTKAGEFTAAPSRAYLENQERDADQVAGLSLKIRP